MNIVRIMFASVLCCLFSASALAEILDHFRFRSSNAELLDSVSKNFEIIERDGDVFDVLVLREFEERFVKMVPVSTLVERDVNAHLRDWESDWTAKGYRSFDRVKSSMLALQDKYPSLVRVEQYGESENGLPLLKLRISDNVGVDEGEPKVILDAATHGDEIIGTEISLRIIEEWLQKYGTDSSVNRIFDSLDISFVPVVNPEGYSRNERYSSGVDPNRDYPWPESPEHKSVACIAALRNLFAKEKFVGSLTLHAYGKLVMYPWAYTPEPVADAAKRAEMESLTSLMAQENGYVHGPIATTIYVARGSSSDYYFWKHGTVSVAMELGRSKAPVFSEIPNVMAEARPSIVRFFEHFL